MRRGKSIVMFGGRYAHGEEVRAGSVEMQSNPKESPVEATNVDDYDIDEADLHIDEPEDEEAKAFAMREKLPLHFLLYYLRRKNQEFKVYAELFFYIPFLFFFTWSLLTSKGLSGPGFYIVDGIRGIISDGEWNTGEFEKLYSSKNWADVKKPDNFWTHMKASQAFMNLLQGNSYSLNNFVQIRSPIRFIQWRTDEVKCTKMLRYIRAKNETFNSTRFPKCYPNYGSGTASKKDFGTGNACGVDFPLGVKYGVSGFRWYDATNGLNSKYPGVRVSRGHGIQGVMGVYPLDQGFVFDIDPNWQKRDSRVNSTFQALEPVAKLHCMQTANWIDEATRGVAVVVYYYDAVEDLFARQVLLAEIASSGLWITSQQWVVYKVVIAKGGVFFFREVIFLIYVLAYVLRFLFEAFSQKGRVLSWLFSTWNIVEGVNLAILLWGFIWRIKFWAHPVLEFEPNTDTPDYIKAYPDWQQQIILDSATFDRLQTYTYHHLQTTKLLAVNGLLCYLKIFKFLGMSPHFSLLTDTVVVAIPALLSVVFYLFLLMIAFSMMAVMLYGNAIMQFRSAGSCLSTLFRMALGDSDYQSMNEVEPAYTPVFFFLFVLFVWLLLLNMIVGIISQSFSDAKSRQEEAIFTVASYFFQKSIVVDCVFKFKKLSYFFGNITADLKKEQSPIRWNGINRVKLPVIIAVLDDMEAKRSAATPVAYISITREEFVEAWKSHPRSTALRGDQSAEAIADKIWKLMCSKRESLHTLGIIYEETNKRFDDLKSVRDIPLDIKPMKMEGGGIDKMEVRLERAMNLINRDMIGASDPFVEVKFANLTRRSRSEKDTLNPEWQESVVFRSAEEPTVGTLNSDLLLTVYDKDVASNDLLGRCVVKSSRLQAMAHQLNHPHKLSLSLLHNKNFAGTLELSIILSENTRQAPLPQSVNGVYNPYASYTLKGGDIQILKKMMRDEQVAVNGDLHVTIRQAKDGLLDEVQEMFTEYRRRVIRRPRPIARPKPPAKQARVAPDELETLDVGPLDEYPSSSRPAKPPAQSQTQTQAQASLLQRRARFAEDVAPRSLTTVPNQREDELSLIRPFPGLEAPTEINGDVFY